MRGISKEDLEVKGFRMGWRALAGMLVAILAVHNAAEARWVWYPQTGRWIDTGELPKETAQLQIDYARSLMTKGDLGKALDETEKFSTFYADSELADENQFLRGEIRMAQGDYLKAAKEFQQVISGYPQSDLYDEVIAKQYEIGDFLYKKGQEQQDDWWRLFQTSPFEEAVEVYGMVIENEPFTDAAAEAQYKTGLCHFTREEYQLAALEYQRVIEYYATSDWVDDASYSLAMCYCKSSLEPAYDQVPSMLAIRAIDTFKARFPGDERGRELDEKRVVMRDRIAMNRLETARFYEKRRQFEAARIYYEVVVDQFPETSPAEEARRWLDENPNVGKKVSGRPLGG